MRITLIRFKLALLCAVFLLSISVFANRVVLAKTYNLPISNQPTITNLPTEQIRTTNLAGITNDVYQQINRKRKARGLKPLFWHDRLSDMAYDYSEQMAVERFFSHYDRDGNSVVDRAEDYNLKNWRKIGENLFHCEGYRNPANIAVSGWLKSSTHRRNIYDREWTHTGIGVYQTRSGKVYITQVFLTK